MTGQVAISEWMGGRRWRFDVHSGVVDELCSTTRASSREEAWIFARATFYTQALVRTASVERAGPMSWWSRRDGAASPIESRLALLRENAKWHGFGPEVADCSGR